MYNKFNKLALISIMGLLIPFNQYGYLISHSVNPTDKSSHFNTSYDAANILNHNKLNNENRCEELYNSSNSKKKDLSHPNYHYFNITYKHINIPKLMDFHYGGPSLDLRLSRLVSINYSALFGKKSDGTTYFHVTPGLMLIILIVASGDPPKNLDWFYLLIIPEAVNFHIRVAKWLDILPYIGFGGFEVSGKNKKGTEDEIYFFWSPEVGVKFNFLNNNLLGLSFFGGFYPYPLSRQVGFTLGAQLGILF